MHGMADSQSQRQTDDLRELQLEILRLQTKLSELHNTDGVADKRALQTLQQHVQMLQEECKGIGEHIAGLDVDPFSRQVVEEELGAISATALATYIADRLIKASKMIDSKELRGVLMTLSLTYVGWRLSFGLVQKLKRKISGNKQHMSELKNSWQKVAARVEVMGQLADRYNANNGRSDGHGNQQ